MSARAVALALALTLAACARDPAPRPAVGTAAPADAAPVDADRCVEDCVAERQMAAMSPEAIRAACVADCARAP